MVGRRIKKKNSLQSLSSAATDSTTGQRRKKVSIYDQYQKDFKSVRNKKKVRKFVRDPNKDARITINVNGHKYETYIDTLNRYPDTLLGNKTLRDKYYDVNNGEITLFRNLQVFEAVLFYYQSDGILSRPAWVTETEFLRELAFYQLPFNKFSKNKTAATYGGHKNNKKEIKTSIFQQVIWDLMEHPDSSTAAHILAIFSILTIILSIITFCLETIPAIINAKNPAEQMRNRNLLYCFETAVMVWFTMEYLLRVISAPKRLKFLTSFIGVIDLIVILPYFINLSMNENLKTFNLAVFRIIRMFRVFRVFKLTRYSTGMKVLGRTIVESLGQLVALFLCLFLAAIIFASCLYYIELDSKDRDTFKSIPDSFWYVIITMSSVGYGDVIPSTYIGRVTAAFCMISGIIVLLCLPTPVFITHFGRFYDDVINKSTAAAEDGNIIDLDGSDIWKNEAEDFFVPKWVSDNEWKERIRNDVKQQLMLPGINIYSSNTNLALSRACSREVLHVNPHTISSSS